MESPSHASQCPDAPAMGRRTVEVTSEEWTGVQTSEPDVCESGFFDSPPPLWLSPATAAAHTRTPRTKPEAGTLVASCRLRDALLDQSPVPSLTLTGTMCLESSDPRMTFSVQASITGQASVSAAPQHGAQRLNRKSDITREASTGQYCRDLCLQVEERKQQMERQRIRDVVDEQQHNDTMLHSVWGMPGSGAPNYHLGTARRTGSLHAAGILPQQQTPVLPPVKRRP